MTDPRETPDPDLATRAEPMQVARPLIDLRRQPDGKRDRQLLFGDAVTVLHHAGEWRLVKTEKDGFHGYVPAHALGPVQTPTHRISVRATHAYERPDLKSPDLASLSFGSRIVALSETAAFIETDAGFIPRQHVCTVDHLETDPVAVAHLFLGTPYLWGGNSGTGIDCSGLVQAACLACGIPCHGDSDQQCDRLGTLLPAQSPYRRNDLLFWNGHVALIMDPQTMLHANAGDMAVAEEGIEAGIARILDQGDGPVTAHKRLKLP
ncbi:NlpC/P60 family protein [uncultured Roseobacter sp.]|uniref:C40 family peptidase n=1 Tax=uncultured Roseobacter sp. TaxID=114847 RepID=UPI002618918D|nr:NlpC/P60 family protein [uncultured Roseobacter sp.]